MNNFLNITYYDVQSNLETVLSGKNQKEMLILVADELEKNAQNIDFLSKIIAAIKYNLEEDSVYAIIKNDEKLTLSALITKYYSKDVLIFGLSNAQLGIYAQQKKYQPFAIQEVRYLFADDLSEIQNQKELKAALWDSLKKMFLA